MDIRIAVLAGVCLAVLALGAFAHTARHHGADRAAWGLVFLLSALVLGTIAALATRGGWV